MRVLVSGGLKTDAITRAMEKAFSDGSVLFTSENFIKNIENFLSRGNYFDRAIIMEQSLTENGNNMDDGEMREVVGRLVDLITNRLLEQEVLFVLNTESIADLVNSEIFLASDRMKVLLYTSKEKYKVALFKALALTSFKDLGTNINTKNLLYSPKEVETTEVYDESSMYNTGNEEQVVVQINEDTPLDTPEDLGSSLFNDGGSIPDDVFVNQGSMQNDMGEIPDAFDRPQELGAILDDGNLGFGEIPADEPIIAEGVAGGIDDLGTVQPVQEELFNKDTFSDDFGDGIDTTEQTNANGYEDVFKGVPDVVPSVGVEEEAPVVQNPIMFDDNLGYSQNEMDLNGFSTQDMGSSNNNGSFDDGLGVGTSAIPENDNNSDQFGFPDALGDSFGNDDFGNDNFGVDNSYGNEQLGNELDTPYSSGNDIVSGGQDLMADSTPPYEQGNDNLDLFGGYDDQSNNNSGGDLGSYFDDPDEERNRLEVDESYVDNSSDGYSQGPDMGYDGMGGMNNMNGMNNGMGGMPGNGMPGNGMPNGMPGTGNGLPPQKQKKGLFGGLGKKKGANAAMAAGGAMVAAGGAMAVANGMNNMNGMPGNGMPNSMPGNMQGNGMPQNNMPMVPQKQKKGLIPKGNKGNNGGGLMVPQGPTQVSIDPTRVRDDELVTMMNSYRIRGNCMVITGTGDSGSSTMAANLANVISKMGYTVLLVDMDNIGRTQAYITKEVYSTIHSTDPSSNSLRLSINNKTGEVSRYATIVREGLNIITTGLAVDFEDLSSIVRDGRMLQNFIYGAKAAYNFVIFDVKFLDATGYLKEVVLNADSLVLNVKPNNKGLIEFMLKMGNIDDIRVREDMFRRSGIVFNMATNNKNVLGYKVKNYTQMLEAIDKITEELTGYTGEQSFGQIKIFNEIPFDPSFDNYIFGKNFYSDSKEGNNLYRNILRSILINR